MRNGYRELLRLVAFSHGFNLSGQDQHPILGAVTDVLLIHPACNHGGLIVLFNAVIQSTAAPLAADSAPTG